MHGRYKKSRHASGLGLELVTAVRSNPAFEAEELADDAINSAALIGFVMVFICLERTNASGIIDGDVCEERY